MTSHILISEVDGETQQLTLTPDPEAVTLTVTTGQPGPKGDTGDPGADGADGEGVPAGGTTGQVLKKASGTDYDTEWDDESGGGGSGLPDGGTAGQILTKDSGVDGDASWQTVTAENRVLTPRTFTYGVDTDGVFWWLGTKGEWAPFNNPGRDLMSLKEYTPTQSSNIDSSRIAMRATDRILATGINEAHTSNSSGEWWQADFGASRTFLTTYVVISGRSSSGGHPRNFKIQDSSNGSDWTDLATVTGAGPNNGSAYAVACTGGSASRYVRVLMTGVNEAGGLHLIIGDIEFYGTLDAV